MCSNYVGGFCDRERQGCECGAEMTSRAALNLYAVLRPRHIPSTQLLRHVQFSLCYYYVVV